MGTNDNRNELSFHCLNSKVATNGVPWCTSTRFWNCTDRTDATEVGTRRFSLWLFPILQMTTRTILFTVILREILLGYSLGLHLFIISLKPGSFIINQFWETFESCFGISGLLQINSIRYVVSEIWITFTRTSLVDSLQGSSAIRNLLGIGIIYS